MHIGDWVAKRARLYPGHLFVKEDGRELDNAAFNARVNQTAHALSALGVAKGVRVVVLMANTSAFLEVFFACAKIGALIVPVNTHLATEELMHIIGDASARVLISSADMRAKIAFIEGELDDDIHFLTQGAEASDGTRSLENFTREHPSSEPGSEENADLADPLMIMYTSGTTGRPKGAVLTHGNFLFGAIHSLLNYQLDRSCKSLVVAPLFHIGALAASVTPVIYAGGSLVLKSFDNPSDIISCIMEEKISFMFAVPVMYDMMAKAPRWPSADFSSIRFFIAGGAPMPVPLIRRYQEEKGVQFAQGYGMTETLRITALDLADASRKVGSIGKEVFHTSLKIMDDAGREVPPGDTGEIVVQGPTVFKGYWNNPQATETVLRDGWFHTGDLGRRDGEGFIYVAGRKSDLIICAGENIYAPEVEHAIEAHPHVAEAGVVGVQDAKRGEVAAAFVRLEEGRLMKEDDLLRFLEDKIAAFKHPRKIRFVTEALPRNRLGKLIKDELKAMAAGRKE
jgi:fatty-acyl-CoA synthase